MISKLKAWIMAQGGWYHFAAVAILFLVSGYAKVPAFKVLCLQIWGFFPLILREVFAAVGGLCVLYYMSHQATQVNVMKVKVAASLRQVRLLSEANGAS